MMVFADSCPFLGRKKAYFFFDELLISGAGHFRPITDSAVLQRFFHQQRSHRHIVSHAINTSQRHLKVGFESHHFSRESNGAKSSPMPRFKIGQIFPQHRKRLSWSYMSYTCCSPLALEIFHQTKQGDGQKSHFPQQEAMFKESEFWIPVLNAHFV